jgi:hypothetical protein
MEGSWTTFGMSSQDGLCWREVSAWTSYAGGRTWLAALQRQNAENLKQIFPEKEYRGLSPNFHIHVSVSELYIPTNGSACSAGGNMYVD